MTYFHTSFHPPGLNVNLVIALKPKVQETFCMSSMVLFYLWQKYYLNKSCLLFSRCVTIHHFTTLNWVSLKCNKFCCLHFCRCSLLNVKAVKLLGSTQCVTLWEWVWCRPLTFFCCRGEECVEPYFPFRNVLIARCLTKQSEKNYIYYWYYVRIYWSILGLFK